MLELPIEATPSQQFLITLAEQNCTVNLYQRGERLYLDLLVDNDEVVRGAVCLPRVPLIQVATHYFDGNFYFTDERSSVDLQQPPQWRGLGARYHLYYLEDNELSFLDGVRATRAMEAVNG